MEVLRVQKWGNSQGIRLPKKILKDLGIGVNDKIFKLAVILPITNNIKDFPFHVLLDERTNIKGAILCEHLRTVGLEERKYDKIEEIPEDLLEEVLEKVSLIFQ
ncbi:type II toxin-antitoxin system PemK/MazF family toxin [Fusobacterium watanabei]|uniref:type II toxin-antitoxin system PemK/MazF family toxin n=1 Tax=Fusobacterium watanabei TaxID=2686067 RepID=UPI003B58B1B6